MSAEPEDTLRADLVAAFDDATPDSAPDSAPDAIPDSAPDSAADSIPDSAPVSPKDQTDTPPQSLSASAKAAWKNTPPEVRADIIRREKEVEQGFTKLDEDRQFGKALKDVVAPYMPMIQSEGGTPITAVQSLFNTAYVLRTATPQKKGELLVQLAQEFGAELPNGTNAVQPDSEISQLKNKIFELENNIRQQPEVFKQQQERSQVKRDVDAFAANPKNVHFEKLKPVMASLLENGTAKDMQDAYDKAQWADPDIRSSLLVEQNKASEAKRVAEIKAKADAARKAGASVTGSPGHGQGLNGTNSNGSLRDDISAAWEEHAA